MIRRFGEPPISNINYILRPGAYAILQHDDQVLLTFQDAPFSEFQLPGGGIDPNENILPALRREVMEETGYTIGAATKVGAFRRFVHMPEYDIWAEKLCHIFYARPALRRGPPTEAGHTSHWVSKQQAIDLVANTGDRHFLRRIFNAL